MVDVEIDPNSFSIGRFVGAVAAWCEAARAGAKKMSLSSPFPPEDYGVLLPYVERVAKENEVQFYLEKELMTTDLFAHVDMTGKWVFIIYGRKSVLEGYLTLKAEKESLGKEGRYVGQARRNVATRMGKLLGYAESYIERRLVSASS